MLLSGGLDSAVLLAEEAARAEVQPIYVSFGLAWEPAERDMAGRFLAAIDSTFDLRPLVSLEIDMRDVYPSTHWALVGRPPAYHTPDEDVYLPGRNVVLLGKAGCSARARASAAWSSARSVTIPSPTRHPSFAGPWRTPSRKGWRGSSISTRRTPGSARPT